MSRSRGRRAASRVAAAAALALMLLPGVSTAAEEAEARHLPADVFDAAVLRPLTALSIAAGVAPFLVSVPFMAPTGRLGATWDLFVLAPYDYTFERELGDF